VRSAPDAVPHGPETHAFLDSMVRLLTR